MELSCAFRRNIAAETMTAVRKQDPPELVDRVRPISPALERRMVRSCFEKAAQRFQSPHPLLFAHSTPAHAGIPGCSGRRKHSLEWPSRHGPGFWRAALRRRHCCRSRFPFLARLAICRGLRTAPCWLSSPLMNKFLVNDMCSRRT